MARMLAYDPAERLNLQGIKQHPWWNGEMPSYAQVLEEFTQRKLVNDEEAEKERAEKQAQRARTGRNCNDRRRGLGDEEEEEKVEIEEFELSKPINVL